MNGYKTLKIEIENDAELSCLENVLKAGIVDFLRSSPEKELTDRLLTAISAARVVNS